MTQPTPTIEDAIQLALTAHRGQVDKAGQPYILHPLRVMLRLQDATDRIVAVLHDVVEDTEISLAKLRAQGYPAPVVAALDCLTRRDGESYEQFIERIVPNQLACRVKLADLADNLDASRLPELTERDRERMARYQRARARLIAALQADGAAANGG